MANPANSVLQNLLPVQAYFAVDGTFQTFIGQGVPFYATLNPVQSGLTITNSTIDSSTIGATSPSTGVFTNISTTTGTISTTPSANTDIANKFYVDTVAQGLGPKAACAVGSTVNITTLSGLLTIDGYTVTAGQRVLVKNQTASQDNGIYVASASAWTRATDMDVWSEVPGAYTVLLSGGQANTGWVCTATATGTIGVTAMPWVQFSGTGAYFAGTGLTLASNTFSITNTGVTAASYGSASQSLSATVNAQGQLTSLSAQSIAIGATQITSGTIDTARISGSYTGITGVGTLTVGIWNASTIGVAYGGTGATTLTGYVKGGGTTPFTASTTIPNTDISGLGTMSTQNANSVAITGGSATLGTLITSGLTGYLYGNASSAVTASTTIPTSALSGNFVSTFSAGTTGFTPSSNTTGAVTLSGTLNVANGGTGVTASTGANSVVLRDASVNISANTVSEGFSNVAAAGTTTVLTVASVPNYVVTGSGGQTYQLPDATTLANGANYTFNNNQSSGTIVVKNNSSTTVATIQSGGYVDVILLSNSIAAGSWDVHNFAPSNVSWSTNTFDYAGSFTSGTWNGNAVAYNRGGTGQSSLFVAGGIVYGSTTTALAVTTAGTTGQVLTSNGSSAPSWSTPTSYATVTDDTTTNATRYPLYANATSGNLTTEYVSSTKYQFNPSTGVLTATQFTGSGAGLTSIPNSALTNSSITVGSTAISLGGSATTIAGLTLVTSTTFVGDLTGNASTATTATTATNATNIAITDNTSSVSTYYPVISSASTGNVGATTSSTKLSFVPNTGVLSATSFTGAGTGLTGTASSLSIGGNALNVTGTVAIANGGTGQTTASAGFNALSPVTSTGDLIIGNGVNSATRLAIGTNNYVLTSNGTTASWQASSGGGISWQTVQTTNFSASTGNGYPINTTSGAITVTLPASPSAGNTIYLLDYAGKFATNNLTINPNGNKFNGVASNATVSTNRESLGLVYIDATQGWIPFDGFNTSTPLQPITVDFLVIAGGGGAGSAQGGAGGAGGYRTSAGTSGGGGSAESQLTLSYGTAYTVTVGAGGAGGASGAKNIGVQGSNSVFSTITSTGGGYGATSTTNGGSGGSGGGAGNEGNHTGGSGTANQGYAGGNATNGASNYGGGGGGGAGGVGSAGTSTTGGNGGLGVASSITGTSVTRASGGAAGTYQGGTVGTASAGGGGSAGASGASANNQGTSGTVNTGGGAGGNSCSGALDITVAGATGGSGVVIIKLLSGITATFSSGVTQTSATSGSYKIYTITATSTTSETVTFS